MTTAAPQFLGLSWLKVSWAFPLHSLKTDLGTIFSARAIPRGAKIRSSKYPKRGMKSGIKSIGLKAYPTTQAANTLAGQGALGGLGPYHQVPDDEYRNAGDAQGAGLLNLWASTATRER